MEKKVLFLVLALFLAGCSSTVINENQSEEEDAVLISELGDADRASEYFINGAMYDLKNQYADAIKEYNKALRLDPKPGIHYALGLDYMRINKLAAALKHAHAAVKLDSTNIDYYGFLAQIYFTAMKYDSAETAYQKILTLDSLNYTAYYNLGRIYEKDRPIKALSVYNKLIELTGPEWSILVKVADLNERMGNVDETVKSFEELLALNPASLELQKLLIESYLKTEKVDKAKKLVTEALLTFPDDMNLIEYDAQINIRNGNWVESAHQYQKLLSDEDIPLENKISVVGLYLNQSIQDSSLLVLAKDMLIKLDNDSTHWQIKAFLGEVYLQENNDSLAVNYFRESADMAAWNSQIWTRLGQILFSSSRYEDASVDLQKAVTNFPDDYLINFILGLSLSQINKNDKAEPYLKKATELNPTDANSLSAYGFTLNRLNKNDEAVKVLEKALSLDSLNYQVLGMLGMIFNSKKEWEKCDYYYSKALKVDSTDATLLNNYAYSLSVRGIELDRALKMVSKALESDPENSSFLDTIGWIYYMLGDYEKAEEHVLKSLKVESANSEVLDHLAQIYNKIGNTQMAIEYLRKAVEVDPNNQELKLKLEEFEK
ncbi:MAG: tetratricopeptide repeat protein [bacterium]